jgi:hypothetical protein
MRNRTVAESFFSALANDELEAASRLIGQWFRELTLEQGAALDGRLISAKPPAASDPGLPMPELQTHTQNVFQLDGGAWRVGYRDGNESGTFTDRKNSVERRLARMLAEPNRRFCALDFYPPPSGVMAIPKSNRDESSDSLALQQEKKRLTQLVIEIQEAEAAQDTEEAEKLRDEFEKLTKHCKSEMKSRKQGHKKRCGTLSPPEKADQAIRVGLERLKNRLKSRGLPKLADHLDKFINNSSGEWQYAPPPGTSQWNVIFPKTTSE